jgi:hypothetical protein
MLYVLLFKAFLNLDKDEHCTLIQGNKRKMMSQSDDIKVIQGQLLLKTCRVNLFPCYQFYQK